MPRSSTGGGSTVPTFLKRVLDGPLWGHGPPLGERRLVGRFAQSLAQVGHRALVERAVGFVRRPDRDADGLQKTLRRAEQARRTLYLSARPSHGGQPFEAVSRVRQVAHLLGEAYALHEAACRRLELAPEKRHLGQRVQRVVDPRPV